MDISNFHSLDFRMTRGVVFAKQQDLNLARNIAILGGKRFPDEPVCLIQSEGTKWTDFLRASLETKIVSRHFVQILENNQFNGWRAYETIIADKDGNHRSDYSGLSIIGKCGPPNDSLSTPFEKVRVPGGKPTTYLKGLYVGLDSWDGSDLFIPETTIIIVVTSQVRAALEKAKLTNLEFKCLADWEFTPK
jgi:hypothetical protein